MQVVASIFIKTRNPKDVFFNSFFVINSFSTENRL